MAAVTICSDFGAQNPQDQRQLIAKRVNDVVIHAYNDVIISANKVTACHSHQGWGSNDRKKNFSFNRMKVEC